MTSTDFRPATTNGYSGAASGHLRKPDGSGLVGPVAPSVGGSGDVLSRDAVEIELEVAYTDKEDLPRLYYLVAAQLNLAPNQHTEEPIKAILGGAMNLVNELGTLRNRLSDSHGRGGTRR